MKRNAGFSLLEMLLTIGIIATGIYVYSIYERENTAKYEANQLATQTIMYAKAFAPFLNDLSESRIFNMINRNYCVRNDSLNINSVNIFGIEDLNKKKLGVAHQAIFNPGLTRLTCKPLEDGYYDQNLTGINLYRQKPCVGVIKNTAGKLQSFLFWVATPTSTIIPRNVAKLAAIKLGSDGGYLTDKNIVGQGGWVLQLDDPRLADPNKCGGNRIATNSVFFNMSKLIASNTDLRETWAFAREKDKINPKGNNKNKNTVKTNILLNGNKIILDNKNDLSIQYKGGKTLATGNAFYANSLMATESVATGTACSANEVGTIKKQSDPELITSGIPQSISTCSDAEMICSFYGSRYCYLPSKQATVKFDFDSNRNRGKEFTCPGYAPFLISATTTLKDSYLNVYEDSENTMNFCLINNGIGPCSMSFFGGTRFLYVLGNATRQIINPYKAYQHDVIFTVENKSMKRGIQIEDSDLTNNCSTLCGMIQMGTTHDNYFIDRYSRKEMCVCSTNTGLNIGKVASIEKYSSNPQSFISSAICTSKMVVEAN